MITHFRGFTSDTMRAFGEELSAERVRRRELVEQTRSYTVALLESARRLRHEAETERRQVAAQDADTRRLFTSELRSEVHALRTRFELARRDVAADFLQMVTELRAARETFRGRPERLAKPAPRHNARAAAKPVESKPVEAKAVKTKPVVTRTKPVETKPVETKMAVAKPVQTKAAKTAKAARPATRAKAAERSKPAGHERKPAQAKKNHG